MKNLILNISLICLCICSLQDLLAQESQGIPGEESYVKTIKKSPVIFEGKEYQSIVWYDDEDDKVYETRMIKIHKIYKGEELLVDGHVDISYISKEPAVKKTDYKYIIRNNHYPVSIYFCDINNNKYPANTEYFEIENDLHLIENDKIVFKSRNGNVAFWGNNKSFKYKDDVYKYLSQHLDIEGVNQNY